MRVGAIMLCSVYVLGCGASDNDAARPATAERDTPVVPGEEPLETEVLGEETVRTLPETPRTAVPPPSPSRPCNWAEAWDDPSRPNPLLAGVGGVPSPDRLQEAPIQIPMREPVPEGEIVVELVIGSDGSVAEAVVVRTTSPRWPEAEEAVLESVRTWRFEAPRFDGTPVSVCTTLRVRP